MGNSIVALLQAIGGFFDWKSSENGVILEKDIVKNKKNFAKAVDYAEHALLIAERYSLSYNKKDKKRFDYLLKQFRRYN